MTLVFNAISRSLGRAIGTRTLRLAALSLTLPGVAARRSARPDVAATCMSLLAILVAGPARGTFFDFSDVGILVETKNKTPFKQDKDEIVRPADSNDKAEAFLQLSGEAFGKVTNHGAFASAAASPAHEFGVGAAGFFFGRVENNKKEAGTSTFFYDILPIDVSVLGGDGIRGETAEVTIEASKQTFRNGVSLGVENLFNYTLSVRKVEFAADKTAFDVRRSEDLKADAGIGEDIVSAGVFEGVHYDGFSGARFLGTIEPGDTVKVTYIATADIAPNSPEFAAQAFIGDPFDFSGIGGSLQFVEGDVVAPPPPPDGNVPEPGTLGILGLGLALFGIASRQRQKLGDLE
jgi:PEP-CTERM motif